MPQGKGKQFLYLQEEDGIPDHGDDESGSDYDKD